jgi:hypothetical protein
MQDLKLKNDHVCPEQFLNLKFTKMGSTKEVLPNSTNKIFELPRQEKMCRYKTNKLHGYNWFGLPTGLRTSEMVYQLQNYASCPNQLG